MKTEHKVSVMHKGVDRDGGELAVGAVLTFPKSGTSYIVQETGAVVRANPKPTREERREARRQRRAERRQQLYGQP